MITYILTSVCTREDGSEDTIEKKFTLNYPATHPWLKKMVFDELPPEYVKVSLIRIEQEVD